MKSTKAESPTPPRLPEGIVNALAWPSDRSSIRENLREEYAYICETRGDRAAHLWYWIHMVRTIFPFIRLSIYWRCVMFTNYLKVAIRNFFKYKSFSIINILGLAIGMACCLLITLWIQDEWRFDKFNKNLDDIYWVVQSDSERSAKNFEPSIPAPLLPYLKDNYAGIRYAARFKAGGRRLFSIGGKSLFEDQGGFADPEIFDIFTFPPVFGDPKRALEDTRTLVISKTMSQRYFGHDNPLGKVIKLENRYDFQVGAVIEDIPENSSIRFDYLVRFENFGEFDMVELDNWGRYEQYYGFLVLDPNVSHENFKETIAGSLRENQDNSRFNVGLFPLKDTRLHGFNNDGSLKFILVFGSIGILILLIACINFINLTTAQSGKRAREIGLRKVVGANKSQIIGQIYSELVVTVTAAFLLAIVLALVFLPKLNSLAGKTLSLSLTGNLGLLFFMFGIALLTAFISGTYPALFLSSFTPMNVMKTARIGGASQARMRKLLVVFQFTISLILIVATTTMTKQMRYIQKKDLGFDKDHLAYMDLLGNLKTRIGTVKTELMKNPSINSVTIAQGLPNFAGNNAGGLDWEGKPADIRGSMNFVSVEKDYFKTVGIDFIEGETFRTSPSNSRLAEFIINEKAIEAMGIENPIGKSFKMWDRAPGRIIGVVKNVHNTSLHKKIQPAFYVQFPYFFNYVIFNLKNENVQNTIGFIQDTMDRLNPGYPFEFHFLDENIDRFYQRERQQNSIISSITVLAVFISCLGLFGLSLFLAEQRTKEIGIRKTLGATVAGIVKMMSRDIAVLIAAAILISSPVAYLLMKTWLQNFAYRIALGPWIFILAAALTMLITLLTISFHTIRAASSNPVESLRYE